MLREIKKHKAVLLLGLSITGMSACSSIPTEEFPSTANPSEEISKLEQDRNLAYQNQVNILSPVNYEKADKSLREAKEKREKGKDNEDVLKEVAEGRAYLRRAQEVSTQAQPVLGEAIFARHQALVAEAPKYVAKDFASVDEDLRDIMKKVEKNNTKEAQKERSKLQAKYLDLELRAIKERTLGPARRLVTQAEKEGAKSDAPRTYQYTQKVINDADSSITVARHDQKEVERQGNFAKLKADRLLRITRESKAADRKDSEELILEVENQASIANKMAQENEQILSEGKSNKRYDWVYSQFNKEEAEVLQEKDKLLIRLRGMKFPTGKDYILTENYGLLSKVQNVIKDLGDSRVTVEGHTDTVGSKDVNQKLSQSRADAVKKYLVSNNVIPESRVMSVGYGYAKPLASNKTQQSRDQNRRVDIIIEPETSASR